LVIYRLMRERSYDPALRNAIAYAFECALVDRQMKDREGPQVEVIARKLLAMVDAGETDGSQLRKRLADELNAPGARLQTWASSISNGPPDEET
jgi:hypothetical protein